MKSQINLLAFLLVASLSPASATSYPDPPKNTGIVITPKSLKPHATSPEFTVLTVEIQNTSKKDYFIRTYEKPDPSKVFSTLNPAHYAYVLGMVDRLPCYREGGKWDFYGGDPLPLPGDSWVKFPANTKITLGIPLGPEFKKLYVDPSLDPTMREHWNSLQDGPLYVPPSGTLVFFFARSRSTEENQPSAMFRLLSPAPYQLPPAEKSTQIPDRGPIFPTVSWTYRSLQDAKIPPVSFPEGAPLDRITEYLEEECLSVRFRRIHIEAPEMGGKKLSKRVSSGLDDGNLMVCLTRIADDVGARLVIGKGVLTLEPRPTEQNKESENEKSPKESPPLR